jgi:TPR repeat protein
MRTALALAALFAITGCKSKLDKCTGVCSKLLDENLAKCSTDDCRKDAQETFGACKDLCWTVAGGNTAAKPKLASTEEACHSGTAAACEDLGGMYLLGRGVDKDETKAAQYFKAACNGGVASGCEFYGKMLRDGRGGPADPVTALAMLNKACDGGSSGACTSVGLDAFKHDHAAGVRLLTKACDGNDKLGCMGLGGLYLNGNGVRRDKARAKVLLQKACSLGAQPACAKVRTL